MTAYLIRREYEPLMLNGDAHHSGVEGELSLRIRPVALSKNGETIYQMNFTDKGILVSD